MWETSEGIQTGMGGLKELPSLLAHVMWGAPEIRLVRVKKRDIAEELGCVIHPSKGWEYFDRGEIRLHYILPWSRSLLLLDLTVVADWDFLYLEQVPIKCLMFMEWDVPNFGIDSRFSLRSLTGFVFLAVSFLVVSPYDMIEGGPFQVQPPPNQPIATNSLINSQNLTWQRKSL